MKAGPQWAEERTGYDTVISVFNGWFLSLFFLELLSLSWEDHPEEVIATHSVFLPGESSGPRSLDGYGP